LNVYLDTSVVLRVLLGQPARLSRWGGWQRGYSSEILGVEARRAVDRLRLESSLDDRAVAALQQEIGSLEAAIAVVEVDSMVLRRAGLPMPTVVKTLDAIHLATALLLVERHGVDLVFATHDLQQATAAQALGFRCIGC
jgi:predicted nucleic acid-binding protein